jgi:hypothetical protein
VRQAFDLRQGLQALPGEAFGQQRQEIRDGGPSGELVVRGVQEPLDGLGVEGALEVSGEAGGRMFERDLLVEGDVASVVGARHRRSLGWMFRTRGAAGERGR